MPFSLLDLYFFSEWIILVVMLVVILQRRRQPTAMAWLLIVVFLPWVGAILYYLAGEKRLPRQRIRRHAKLMKRLRSTIDPLLPNNDQDVSEAMPASLEPAVELASRVGYMPIVAGNRMELIADSAECMQKIMDDIDEAEHHVHMFFYIFAADQTGKRMAECLKRAAQRGVTVRLLADSVGAKPMFKELADELRDHGVEVREALKVGIFRHRLHRIDMRNHRKIVVIDSRIGYTGSQNVVDPGYGHKKLVWHDLMMRLTGPTILELQAVFVADWYYESEELLNSPEIFVEQQPTGNLAIQTLPSGPNHPVESYHAMVAAALYQAQQHVVITTPYFVPDDAMLRAILAAHYRGAKVEIIVPERSDHQIVDMASRAIYFELLKEGIDVYFFKEGMLHAKTVTVDGKIGFFGSSNFDIRSFSLNFELNLMFYDSHATSQLLEFQQEYRAEAEKQLLTDWKQRPLPRQLLENLANLFGPVL